MSTEFINLSLGEPKAPISTSLKEALRKGVEQEIFGYTAPIGDKKARQVSAKILETSTSKTFMACGSSGGLILCLNIVCKRDDNVLIIAPYYPQFIYCVEQLGAVPIISNLTDSFSFQFKEIKEISKNFKINSLILNSPHNPTGRVFNENELEKLSSIISNETIVISEESYSSLCYDCNAPNIYDFFPKAIKILSFSKSHGIVGLRLGAVGLGPGYNAKETSIFRGKFSSLQLKMGFVNPCTLAQYAIANVESGFVDINFYKQNRDYLACELKKINYHFVLPEGAFYFFLSVRDADKIVTRLRDKSILINSGVKYGWDNWIRISFSINRHDFNKAVPIIIGILKDDKRQSLQTI